VLYDILSSSPWHHFRNSGQFYSLGFAILAGKTAIGRRDHRPIIRIRIVAADHPTAFAGNLIASGRAVPDRGYVLHWQF
jgi:hypothetical protein